MLNTRIALRWVAVLLFTVPAYSYAHVKWFIDADKVTPDPGLTYHLTDPAVQVWMGIVLLGLIAAYVLDRVVPSPPPKLIRKGFDWHGRILYIFQLIIGAALLTTAIKGAILAPHLTEGARMSMFLRSVEAIVGVLFIFNVWVKFGAIILFGLFITSSIIFGLLMSLEYFNLLGIAVFLVFLKSSPKSWLGRHCDWALPLLRLHTGVAFSVLAFSEKLFRPDLAMAFLEKHGVNFMKNFGFVSFSDHLFVLSAGFCELLFGLIFISGLVTRINTVSIAVFLVASNVYFFFMGKWAEGILEIIGHGNIFAIAIIFIFYGAGSKIRLRPVQSEIVSLDRGRSADSEELVAAGGCEPWCVDLRS